MLACKWTPVQNKCSSFWLSHWAFYGCGYCTWWNTPWAWIIWLECGGQWVVNAKSEKISKENKVQNSLFIDSGCILVWTCTHPTKITLSYVFHFDINWLLLCYFLVMAMEMNSWKRNFKNHWSVIIMIFEASPQL